MDKVRENKQEELAAAIERLKQSKEDAEERDRMFGANAGRDFALRRASYAMLRIIAAMEEDYGCPECYDLEDGADTLVAELASRLEDSHSDSWELKDLAELLFRDGTSKPSPEFLAAFVQAAAETWRQVEAQVELQAAPDAGSMTQ